MDDKEAFGEAPLHNGDESLQAMMVASAKKSSPLLDKLTAHTKNGLSTAKTTTASSVEYGH